VWCSVAEEGLGIFKQAGCPRRIQVVRAIASQNVWRELNSNHSVQQSLALSEAGSEIRLAIDGKARKIPQSHRGTLVLALDATRLAGIAFDAVVREFGSPKFRARPRFRSNLAGWSCASLVLEAWSDYARAKRLAIRKCLSFAAVLLALSVDVALTLWTRQAGDLAMSFRMLRGNPLNTLHFPLNLFQMALVYLNALLQAACSVPQDVVHGTAPTFLRVWHSRVKFCMIPAANKEQSGRWMQRVARMRAQGGLSFTVASTVCEIFAANQCKSAQRGANQLASD
jgi:hypothetical protein